MPPVLSGLTIVELGASEATAYCGRLLADAGALVVKIEPPGGDPARHEGPRGLVFDRERAPLFLHLNRGKRSVVCDLGDAGQTERLRRLILTADVLIESLAPGTLAEYGLGYRELSAANPALIMASVTPYGQTGPYSRFAATDLTLFASTGAMYREGLPWREPMRYAGHLPRTYSGGLAAAMVAAALFRRRRTGRGDWLDLAEMDCWASHPNQITRRLIYAFSGDAEAREDTKTSAGAQGSGFGRGTYRCQDGFVTLLPLGDRHWPRLVELVERPELAEDPRFATREARREHRADWEEIFSAYLATRTMSNLFQAAQRAGLPSAPLYDASRILSDPHLAERGYFQTADHPVVGTLRYPGCLALAAEGFWAEPSAAPLLGADDGLLTQAEDPDEGRDGPPSSGEEAPARLAPQPLPLAGIRALEIAEIWAGPFCGAMLADLGAEVIKVEAIQRSARGAVRPLPGAPGYPNGDPGDDPWNRSAGFMGVNRNKRGITLDLHTEAGQEILDRLLAQCDLVFTNLSMDAQESLNLLPDRLHRANPRLGVILLTGFGLTGPYRYYRSMGMTLDAISGHSVLRGYPDLDHSHITPVHHADGISAATGLLMSVLALERLAQTGEGQVFDIAQLEATIPHLGEHLLDWQLASEPVPRLGNDHPWMAPHGVFRANEEDSWVAVAVDSDERFAALSTAIGRPELSRDPRFGTRAGRSQRLAELNQIVAAWVGQHDRFDAQRLLQAKGVPAAAVLRADIDHSESEQLSERGTLREADFGLGRFRYPRGPWRFCDTEEVRFGPAPRLGQHNHELLAGLLGLPEARIDELERLQVIGSRPLETAEDPVAVRRH